MTMTLIEHYEVPSGGVSSITFTSVGNIPDTYTDLLLVMSMRTNRGFTLDGINVKLNNSTSNFSWRRLFGDGSASSSVSASNSEMIICPASTTANTFGNASVYIPNYRSGVAKSVSADSVAENNATASGLDIRAILWNDTNPITSIVIVSATGSTIQQYSSATLYGITAGSDGTTTVS